MNKFRVLFLAAMITVPTGAAWGQQGREAMLRDVESTLRGALSLVSYGECWRLWDGASRTSRLRTSQADACKVFERATSRPAPGGGIEDFEIAVTSATTAVAQTRLNIELKGGTNPRSIPRSFVFFLEDGRWRYDLSDFLSLLSYAADIR